VLERKSPIPEIARVLKAGKAYYGEVPILGTPYVTGYEPMKDASGAQVGAQLLRKTAVGKHSCLSDQVFSFPGKVIFKDGDRPAKC
jgi:hypothetical protein